MTLPSSTFRRRPPPSSTGSTRWSFWLRSSACWPGRASCPFRWASMRTTSARTWPGCWPPPACPRRILSKTCWCFPAAAFSFWPRMARLFEDIAARLEQRQIKTRLVNSHYLDAMLTPDRMADIARATAQPAALNRDFSPVLYYYHLRHWMSQFNDGFGPVQIALLVLLGLYLVRLRGSALVLFASGFAASVPGDRAVAGLPGALRLGLSSSRHHRDRLHDRPRAGRVGSKSPQLLQEPT